MFTLLSNTVFEPTTNKILNSIEDITIYFINLISTVIL